MNVTTSSLIFIYTDEAMRECHEHLESAVAYLNPKGGFINSPMVDTVTRVLTGMMRR